MIKINGEILSRDRVVATVKGSWVDVKDDKLAPLFFSKCRDIETWLKSRAIDEHRTNSRLLKKALRLQKKDDVSTTLAANAVTITDTYWFRKEGSDLTWDDVRFKENCFDELALTGHPDGFNQEVSNTPELTNIGSYEKCWKLIDNQWWLYKNQTNEEIFSELFVCELGKKIGFSMAHYEMDDKYIRTVDFTENAKYNLEPMRAIIGDNEDYSDNFNALNSIHPDLAADYIKIIYLDTLCLNIDRHTENYGFLTSPDTGEIINLAPNFDNNISLISRGYPKDISRQTDGIIKLFKDFIYENKVAAGVVHNLKIPDVTPEMIDECMNNIPIEADREYIKEFILNGQSIIKEHIERANQTLDEFINKHDSQCNLNKESIAKKYREDNQR